MASGSEAEGSADGGQTGSRSGSSSGGAVGGTLLDALLCAESGMPAAVREEMHDFYFELMREVRFKEALLQHVIRHYPLCIGQAAASPGVWRDTGASTFGKFTVQFKGNLVPAMIEHGLLRMLLRTSRRLMRHVLMALAYIV